MSERPTCSFLKSHDIRCKHLVRAEGQVCWQHTLRKHPKISAAAGLAAISGLIKVALVLIPLLHPARPPASIVANTGITVAGNGNHVVMPGSTQQPSVSAPNGIAVAPGAVANNPTVNNNYSPPRRRLDKQQCARIKKVLAGIPMKVAVGAMLSVPDAYDFAQDLHGCFKAAGAEMVGDIMPMGFSGPSWSGIEVTFKGERAPKDLGRTTVAEGTPQAAMLRALRGLHAVPYAEPSASDWIEVTVGEHPRKE